MAERTKTDRAGDKLQQVVTDTLERDATATGGRHRPELANELLVQRFSSARSDISFEAQLEANISRRRAIRRQRNRPERAEPRPSKQSSQSTEFSRQPQEPQEALSKRQQDDPEREAPNDQDRAGQNRHNAPARSRPTGARSQRRGSILERTSIKLNRLLESSISMLPPPDLSRAAATARHRTRSTMARRSRRPEHGHSGRQERSGSDPARHVASLRGAVKRGNVTDEDRDVDGGYAWVILAVMFTINASTFGTARAYGMIYDKLAREGQLNHDQAARPFNVMGALENMAGPLTGCLLARKTSSWRLTVFIGSSLVTLAHLLAALTPNDSLEGHLLSMGVMCGLGLSFVTISFFQINNAYFVHYRSRAFGIGISGAAFGTLYIAKLCQWALDEYEGTSACYLVLSLLLAPNVLLSLLLKPKHQTLDAEEEDEEPQVAGKIGDDLRTISLEIQKRDSQPSPNEPLGFVAGTKQVLRVPIFHLIWPTQLLFCWFNFVLGMIMVDFAKDRGLSKDQASHIVPVWAFGQLTGRLILSALVDLKLLSYRSFTVICFASVSLTTYILNEIKPEAGEMESWFLSLLSTRETPLKQLLITLALVFVLSAFIALLYILLNGLVVSHMDPQLQPLSIGISSFLGSFFLLPRATAIGFYRDTTGNYDSMLRMFSLVALGAALTWLIVPTACRYLDRLGSKLEYQVNKVYRSKTSVTQKPQLLAVITPDIWRLGTDVKAEKPR